MAVAVVLGVRPSADVRLPFEDGDGVPRLPQSVGGGQPGWPGADDGQLPATDAHGHSRCGDTPSIRNHARRGGVEVTMERRIARPVATLALAAAMATLAGVTTVVAEGDDTPALDGEVMTTALDDPRFDLVLTHPVRFEVQGPEQAFSDEVPCDIPRYRLWGGPGVVELEVVPTDCEYDDRLGNGFHGIYRTIADVADLDADDADDVEVVDTAVGPAEVFTQDYYECTNECNDYVDRIAIVTLDEPSDDDYPTLVVRANKDEVGEDVFFQLLAGLART